MSLTFSPFTVAACLEEACSVIGRPLDRPVTELQWELLCALPPYTAELPHLKQFVRAFAAPTAQEINAQLAAAGFPDMRLEPWDPSPCNFGVAGLLDVQINWLEPGKSRSLHVADVDYPAFLLKQYDQRCLVLPNTGGEPMVSVEGQDGLELRLQVVHSAPESVLHLMEEGRRLASLAVNPMLACEYQGAVVPMVRLKQSPDISWLKHLQTTEVGGGYWEIAQALQRVRFGLNRFGARAMEATAMEFSFRGISMDCYYEVNGPFYATIHRCDTSIPIFAAYVTQADWADPGDFVQMTSW